MPYNYVLFYDALYTFSVLQKASKDSYPVM